VDLHSSYFRTAAAAAAGRRGEHHPILHPFLPFHRAVQGFVDGVKERFAAQNASGLAVEEGGGGGLCREGGKEERGKGRREGEWDDGAGGKRAGLQTNNSDRSRFWQEDERNAGEEAGNEQRRSHITPSHKRGHTQTPPTCSHDLPPTTKPPISMLGTSSSSQLWTARVTCQGGRASAILAIAVVVVVVWCWALADDPGKNIVDGT